MYFCCCRIIKRKSPLPQGKGEPLQTTCILSYAPKITDGHRRGLLCSPCGSGVMFTKKADTGLAPSPVRCCLQIFLLLSPSKLLLYTYVGSIARHAIFVKREIQWIGRHYKIIVRQTIRHDCGVLLLFLGEPFLFGKINKKFSINKKEGMPSFLHCSIVFF